jgi:hypothetical protein
MLTGIAEWQRHDPPLSGARCVLPPTRTPLPSYSVKEKGAATLRTCAHFSFSPGRNSLTAKEMVALTGIERANVQFT